jgi:flagellar biosynthetic protein FliR
VDQLAVNNWDDLIRTVEQTLLLSVRVAALLLVSPLFQAARVPNSAKVILVLGISTAISIGLTLKPMVGLSSGADWFEAASVELMLGATLGLGVSVALAAFSVAGRILDIQIGFSLAQVFDPGTNRQVSVLDSAFTQVGILLFLILQGHHALIRVLALSLERFPVGSTWRITQSADPLLLHAGSLFSLGFALAAPVIFCVLLVELALGVLARNLPQMNMFVVALPVKIAVGLAALGLWFTVMGGVVVNVYSSIESFWSQMLEPIETATSVERR